MAQDKSYTGTSSYWSWPDETVGTVFDEESEYRGSVGEVERQKEKNRERERENSKTTLERRSVAGDQRVSVHGRRSSVSGGCETKPSLSWLSIFIGSAAFPVRYFARFVSPGTAAKL